MSLLRPWCDLWLSVVFFIVMPVNVLCQDVDSYTTADRLYQVNVIVFARNHPTAPPGLFYAFKTRRDFKATQYLNPLSEDGSAPYSLLPESSFQLSETLHRLKNSNDYTPLLAFAWWQGFANSNHWHTYHISGGKLYNAFGQAAPNDLRYFWQNEQSTTAFDKLFWEVNGTLKVTLHKYLDAYVDFQYISPDQSNTLLQRGIAMSPLNVYELNQHMRTRSQKINYLDNPGFGVIIMIMPVDPEVVNTAIINKDAQDE